MSRYNLIRYMDISNGPGIRVSIFFQGCDFHCRGCFNQNTWDFDKGEELNQEIIDGLLNLCENEQIDGLSILGGEPLHPKNINSVVEICKQFKERFPNKNIWLWTGYTIDYNLLNILKEVDIIVDGQFKEELHDFKLMYRGSSNQRVIDVKESLRHNEIVVLDVDKKYF